MTIQRQYSLPNCKLILQGLSETGGAPNLSKGQVLSMLMSAECHINGQEPPLTGGRDFFESLVIQVSSYAQEFLSGISSSRHQKVRGSVGEHSHPDLVQLENIGVNLHRLTVSDEAVSSGTGTDRKPGRIIDLSTVQLFDLVEAVDQFFADSLTLPDLSLKIRPISRKQAKVGEPVAKQAIPAAVGMSGLALAALALFFVPIPEVERIEPKPQTNEDISGVETSPTSTSEPGLNPTPTPESVDSSIESTMTDSPEVGTVDSTEETLTGDNLEPSLNTAEKITDSADISQLQDELRGKINDAWKQEINKDLIYRVTVASDGSIIGYKPISPEAADEVDKTPLPDLLNRQAVSEDNNQSITEFKVLFQENGILKVEPW
ncbi:MAG: DUF4335 domain-containing protein [Microcoleaceae cyanobacterium]